MFPDNMMTYQRFLRKTLNCAGPVLVSDFENDSQKLWYKVLKTTRLLIAHISLSTTENYTMLSIIAHNLRNLYRLFGMDLSDHHIWKNVVLDVMYYGSQDIEQLKLVEYKTVSIEFENEIKSVKQCIWRCIYNLVGKRKSYWKIGMDDYNKLLESSNEITLEEQFVNEYICRPGSKLNL